MNYLISGTNLHRNRFKITRFIAQGGFGITYLADEIGYYKLSGFGGEEYVEIKYPDKAVIKELYYSEYCQRNELTGIINVFNTEKRVEFEKLVAKQLEEGRILRSLKHPNIFHTRDIYKKNETAYMVMDYVESTDLEELVRKNGRLTKETTWICASNSKCY